MAYARTGLLLASATVVGPLLVLGSPLTSAPALAGLLALTGRRPQGRMPVRPRLGSEHGSILVEVTIGTLLLALTTTAVLNGMDGAQDAGRRNKDRSVSATLAQQDLERMRSMPPSVLANLHQVRTVTVAGEQVSAVVPAVVPGAGSGVLPSAGVSPSAGTSSPSTTGKA